jgi:hypothetical protein
MARESSRRNQGARGSLVLWINQTSPYRDQEPRVRTNA